MAAITKVSTQVVTIPQFLHIPLGESSEGLMTEDSLDHMAHIGAALLLTGLDFSTTACTQEVLGSNNITAPDKQIFTYLCEKEI